jgi:hypothetical protein
MASKSDVAAQDGFDPVGEASRVASSQSMVGDLPAASPLITRGASGICSHSTPCLRARDGVQPVGWPTQMVGVAGSIPRSASLADFDTESMPSARWISATSSSPGVEPFRQPGPARSAAGNCRARGGKPPRRRLILGQVHAAEAAIQLPRRDRGQHRPQAISSPPASRRRHPAVPDDIRSSTSAPQRMVPPCASISAAKGGHAGPIRP